MGIFGSSSKISRKELGKVLRQSGLSERDRKGVEKALGGAFKRELSPWEIKKEVSKIQKSEDSPISRREAEKIQGGVSDFFKPKDQE